MSLMVRESTFYKNFFRLTLLIGLQNVITIGVNLSDNLILGGYSESALSGAALANQIQFFVSMLVMGVSEAVVILGSRFWGANQLHSIKKISSVGMALALALSFSIWIVVYFFPTNCLSLLTNEQSIIVEGARYLKIISFSYVFFAITNILLASLRSMEIVKIGFIVSLSTLVINICLNYLLVYGHFGFSSMGIRGSAIGTLIARIIETMIVILYIKKAKLRLRIKFSDYLQLDMTMLKQYIKIGSPILLANFIWAAAMAVQTAILGHMGEASIAANSVATTIFQLVTVVIYASASATTVLIGKAVGEGVLDRVKAYSKTLQILYVLIGIVTGLILFITKDHVLSFYAISAESKTLALQFMTILSITVCGTAYQMPALTGIVRSGGDTKFVMYNDFIFMFFLVLPLSYMSAFVFNFSPIITFIFLKSDQILKCIVAVFKVNRYKWIRVFDHQA
ncbi:MATE family efflux transporter [Paenibacillus segetis]|uniref:MATE family efflux transporter n=1 Tax=Paenibacillus segetis TaxID=1325360 RepID=A0ABQ1YBF8_9BACL|nr:MATE family efflux transporter [Paenibacillus segetis]GGH19853.1 MATE family efflux transporter [Paenibacillus segetis]